MIGFQCPDCGKRFKAPDDYAGRDTQCSNCKRALRIPHLIVQPSICPAPVPLPVPVIAPHSGPFEQPTSDLFGSLTLEESPRPSLAKRQAAGNPLGLFLLAGLLTLLGGGVGAYLFLVPSKPQGEGKRTTTEAVTDKDKGGTKTPKVADRTASPNSQVNLDNAVSLLAPPLNKDDPAPIRSFTSRVRELASGSKDVSYPPGTVFRTVFDQDMMALAGEPKSLFGRNVSLHPGTFDKAKGQSTWEFCLWHHFVPAKEEGALRLPENTDTCVIRGSIKQTEGEARQWKDAHIEGTLRVEVWYRIQGVERRQWEKHPWLSSGEDELPGGVVYSHNILLTVEVLNAKLMNGPASSPLPGDLNLAKREELIAAIERKYRKLATETDAELKAYDRAKAELDAKFRADPQGQAILLEFDRLHRALEAINQRIDQNGYNYNQELRRAMLDQPKAGDPKFIVRDGVIYTERELLLAQIEEKYRPVREQHDAQMQAWERVKADVDARAMLDRGNPVFLREYNQLKRQLDEITKKQISSMTDYHQEVRKVMLAHKLADDPKLIEYEGLIYTEDELAALKGREEVLGNPRRVAEDHIRKLMRADTVTSANYDGIVYLNKEKTSAGACFQLEIVVRGRPFANKAWYVTLKKEKDAWQVVPVIGDGAELRPGLPAGTRDKTGAGKRVIPIP